MTENLFKRILTPVRLRKSDIGGRVPLEEFFSDKSRENKNETKKPASRLVKNWSGLEDKNSRHPAVFTARDDV